MNHSAGHPSDPRPRHITPAACEATAAAWLMRRDAGLDAAGEREFAAWLAADSAHAEAYAQMSEVWSVFGRAVRRGASEAVVTQLAVRARRRRVRSRLTVGVVATAAAVLIVAFWPRRATETTGEPASAITRTFAPIRKLPDGSIVELNEGAELAVQYSAATRHVHLVRGEALFRVEKDAARPFVVLVGAVQVRAVGTAFNVRLETGAVEVLVKEGKVRVAPVLAGGEPAPRELESPLVEAGQRAVVNITGSNASGAVQIAAMAPAEMDERLAWRIPRLEFSDTELARAVELMNQHNRLQIVLGEPALGRLGISGVFRADNPVGFVRIVEKTLDLQAEYRGEREVVLRGPAPK